MIIQKVQTLNKFIFDSKRVLSRLLLNKGKKLYLFDVMLAFKLIWFEYCSAFIGHVVQTIKVIQPAFFLLHSNTDPQVRC